MTDACVCCYDRATSRWPSQRFIRGDAGPDMHLSPPITTATSFFYGPRRRTSASHAKIKFLL